MRINVIDKKQESILQFIIHMKLPHFKIRKPHVGHSIIKKNILNIVFFVAIFQSCTKDENAKSASSGDAKLTIEVNGVEEEPTFTINASEVEDKIARASVRRSSIGINDSEPPLYDIESLPEFDVLSDIQSFSPSSSSPINIIDSNVVNKAAKATSKAVKESSKAVTRMAAQTRYRIIFYEQGSTAVASNNEAIAGTAMEASLDVGKTYNWYAVSINATTVPNINGSGLIASSSLANRDVLYASGVITPVFGANTLQVTFSRRTARLEVDLNVRGMFGDIRNTTSLEIGYRVGSTFASVFQMGDLNIRTGDYTNITDSPAVTGANMTATATSTGDAVKKAIFYTVRNNNIANGSLTVRLNRLDLTMDDASVRSFSTATLVPITGTLTPSYGSRFVINARLIESAIVVNGAYFARTNMVYSPSQPDAGDRYRFRPHNNYSKPDYNNEYWRWRAATPTGTASTTDPCGSVYPAGVWAGPAVWHFDQLGSTAPVISSTIDGTERIARTWTATGNASGNSSGYPSNNLQLLYLGFYTPGSVLENAAENLGSGVGTASADYWTNLPSGSNAGVARYLVTQNANNVTSYGNLTHHNFAQNARRPYRCVRY